MTVRKLGATVNCCKRSVFVRWYWTRMPFYVVIRATWRLYHLQISKQRQHLLDYFKTLDVGPAGFRTLISHSAAWCSTNRANQTAEKTAHSLFSLCENHLIFLLNLVLVSVLWSQNVKSFHGVASFSIKAVFPEFVCFVLSTVLIR